MPTFQPQAPLKGQVLRYSHLLQPLFDHCGVSTDELEMLAVEHGALAERRQHRKKLKTVHDLLDLLLLYLLADFSLRGVAALCALVGIPLTDEGVRQALHRMPDFLEALLARLCRGLPAHDGLGIVDSSHVQGLAAKSSQLRLHTVLRLSPLGTASVRLTTNRTAESFEQVEVGSAQLTIADRGLCRAADLRAMVQRGRHVLVRYHSTALVGMGARACLDELETLEEGQYLTWSYLDEPSGQRWYLHALKLPEKEASRARKQRRRKGSRRQKKVSGETLALCGYLVVVTSLPPERLTACQALALYRCRWQIELLFKRWKSLLDLDKLRCKGTSKLARTWVAGKLLLALFIEHVYAKVQKRVADGRDVLWRFTRLAREWLRARCLCALPPPWSWNDTVMGKLFERSRRRLRQWLVSRLPEVP